MSVTTNQNPIAVLRSQLLSMTPELRNALPSHIKPEKFQRVVMTVVQMQPDLLRADRRSLLASCIKCAADGLIPDGREAALVLFGRQVTYMPMFVGIQKRIRNSGEIASLQAQVVYERDKFLWKQGVDSSIEHEPLFPGDRGKPIGAYAIAKFKDGSDPVIEVMDITDIEKVRAVSRAGKSGPWVQWWDQMARKAVFRRMAKWLPMDADVDDLLRNDEAAEVAQPTGQTIEGDVPTGKLAVLEGGLGVVSADDGGWDVKDGDDTGDGNQGTGGPGDTADGSEAGGQGDGADAGSSPPGDAPSAAWVARIAAMGGEELAKLPTDASYRAELRKLPVEAQQAIGAAIQARKAELRNLPPV